MVAKKKTKKKRATNTTRVDPYRNFNFRVVFQSALNAVRKASASLKANIDAAFTRRIR